MKVCMQAWKEEGNEWMGGPAHKHCKGRTSLVRQRDRVRVDADAAALMLSYELDVSREAAENRCAERPPLVSPLRGKRVFGLFITSVT